MLLGSSNSFLHIQGPYEIVTRVDCVREIPNTNALLLHLDYPVYYNRYILPTYLIASADGEVETEECLTVSIDKFGRLRSWPVRKTIVSCPGGHKCFEQLRNDTTTLCELKGTSVDSSNVQSIIKVHSNNFISILKITYTVLDTCFVAPNQVPGFQQVSITTWTPSAAPTNDSTS